MGREESGNDESENESHHEDVFLNDGSYMNNEDVTVNLGLSGKPVCWQKS